MNGRIINALAHYKAGKYDIDAFLATKAEILAALTEEENVHIEREKEMRRLHCTFLGQHICYHVGDEMTLSPANKVAVVVGHLGPFVLYHWKGESPTKFGILEDGVYEVTNADKPQ